MIALLVMFMMKNKDKRKEIVRRMSRVYANNPILCVMESNNMNINNNSPETNLIRTPIIDGTNFDYIEKKQLKSSKSKLSLSLPQGIDQLHKYDDNNAI